MKPLKRVGRPKSGEGNGDNVTICGKGNGPSYLAARLRRDHPDAAGNAKRAAAAKTQPRTPDGKRLAAKSQVADHSEQRPAGGKAVAREARAAEARVSPATMGRAEQIGRKRPVSGDGTSKTTDSP